MSNLLIIGHRGAPSLAPENTLPAFHQAALTGALIELDVQLSKDKQVVVIHDERLERTTTGNGRVADYTLAQLKTLDAGCWLDRNFAGISIPTLDEVIAELPENTGINIELKTDLNPYPGIEQRMIEIVHQHNVQDRVIISSFNWNSLNIVYRLAPKLKLGLLFNKLKPEIWSKARLLNAYSLHPPTALVSRQLVWQSHSWGYRIFPWVVNNREVMLKFKSMGVDGIITDYPQIFMRNEEPNDKPV